MLFVLAGSAGIAVLILRSHSARALMTAGGATLFFGVAIAVAALSYESASLVLRRQLQSPVSDSVQASRAPCAASCRLPRRMNARVCSPIVFIVSYIAMGLPAVIAGVLIVEQGNLVLTAKEFGARRDGACGTCAARHVSSAHPRTRQVRALHRLYRRRNNTAPLVIARSHEESRGHARLTITLNPFGARD